MRIRYSNNTGVLLLALIFMSTLLSLAGVFMFGVVRNLKTTQGQFEDVQALYMAQAGINKAIYYLANTAPDNSTNGSWSTVAYSSTSPMDCADITKACMEVVTVGSSYGAYYMWVSNSGNGSVITITSRGMYPTDSSGNSITGSTITKTLRVKVQYHSHVAAYWSLDYNSAKPEDSSSNAEDFYRPIAGLTWNYNVGISGGDFTCSGNLQQLYSILSGVSIPNVAFTLSEWVKPSSYPTTQAPILAAYNQKSGMYIYYNGANAYLDYFDDALNESVATAGAISTGAWHHLAITNDSSNTLTFYVDGASVAFTAGTNIGVKSINTICDDSYAPNSNRYFLGDVDEPRIYSRALSAAEISSLYNTPNGSGVTPYGFVTVFPGTWSEL